uniref:RecA family profile 1 domain-containing protein n=1 Tax=Kalanchoe fedtschenkoi TaxID=63787 RepID=A0A7N0ZW17_KALFE
MLQISEMKGLRTARALQLHRLGPRLNGFGFLSLQSSASSHPVKGMLLCRCLSSHEDRQPGQEWVSASWKSRIVRTSYDPILGKIVTEKVPRREEDTCKNLGGEVKDDGLAIKLQEQESLGKSSRGSEKNGAASYREIMGNSSSSIGKKKGKNKVSWVCSDCGHSEGQWWGTCRACDTVGTLKKFSEEVYCGNGAKKRGFEVSENAVKSWLPQKAGQAQPISLADVSRGVNQLDWRIPLSGPVGDEVSRVLGGGLVPGSLVLIGGDPGVGKSTLLLQLAAMIAEGRNIGECAPVVYVTGEESIEQIGNRADRMMIDTEHLYVYSSTDVEDILDKIQALSPRALIVDSIQTVYLKEVTGSAGGLAQVKECTSALLRFAKKTNVPILLIGHVTKSGDIAGPRVLEHIVDVVLYMEGEKSTSHRLLRSVKNRFGSTDELGVLEMSATGLQAILNPSEMFLSEQQSDSDFLAGLAVAIIMDGSRAFLIEIQALCVSGTSLSRQVNGVPASRADMIISVSFRSSHFHHCKIVIKVFIA